MPSHARSRNRLTPIAPATSAAGSANSTRRRWADSHVRGPTPTNGDGNVNDAAILAAHWGEGVGQESVPEPGSLVLLAGIAMMGMTYLRRRKAWPLR